MKKWMYFLISMDLFCPKVFASADDCGAFFIKNGVVATFPILKKREKWEWYKNVRPEYVWMAETGFYIENEFKSNGFGFALNIGAADLKKNPIQQGSLEDLVRFASKNAFLTKESKLYIDNYKREEIKYKTIVGAKIIDNESIAAMIVDQDAMKIAKISNPTHMRLTAILPTKEESYTCYPAIEIVK